jgi:hypothetical protein
LGPSEFEPLLRRPTGDLERELLESAKYDVPDAHARDRMLASLATAVPAAPTSGIRLSKIAPNGRLLYGVGIVIAIGAGIALSFPAHNDAHSTTGLKDVNPTEGASSPFEAPTPPATPSVPATANEAPPDVAAMSLDALPDARAEPANLVRKGTPSKGVEPAARTKAPLDDAQSSLMREIRAVEAARASLSAGNAGRSLSILDEYNRKFPNGAFSVEVSVLRVEALARAGRTSEAKALGKRFLDSHREGAFARRVASTLDSLQ